MKKSGNVQILLPSILFFLLSLVVPAFSYSGPSYIYGWTALLVGLVPAIFGILGTVQGHLDYFGSIAWFANLMLLMSWLFLVRRSRGQAMLASSAAMVLSLMFVTTHKISLPDGGTMEHVSVSYGYYLWVTSIVYVLIAACFFIELGNKPDANDKSLLFKTKYGGKSTKQAYGIYGPDGVLLDDGATRRAISQFDRAECDDLLSKFGHVASTASETIEDLRARCLRALQSPRNAA